LSQPDDKPAPRADVADNQSAAGSIAVAVLLGFLGFLSLLSTGCFGLFAFASRRGQVDGVFLAGMLFMAAVTLGFVFWCRAVLTARREKLLPKN
jgi:hypothetical protein